MSSGDIPQSRKGRKEHLLHLEKRSMGEIYLMVVRKGENMEKAKQGMDWGCEREARDSMWFGWPVPTRPNAVVLPYQATDLLFTYCKAHKMSVDQS